MKKIPILDLSDEIDMLWEEIQSSVLKILRSSKYVLGPSVKAFEGEMAAYLGVRHAIGVNSGTDALVIGLRSLGIKPGDEVITTPYTFVATAEAIHLAGAKSVFVDIEPGSCNLDPKLIESKLSPRSKAILPVHLYGHAVNMASVLEIARRYRLMVLEDVAQAMGGEYESSKLGTLGNAGAFSFYPSKNLGAFGDGGMLVTDDDRVAQLARMLRDHGAGTRYYSEMVGYNSRLDSIQAELLRIKLPHLDHWNELRRQAASRYDELFKGVQGVSTPVEMPFAKHVYNQYTVSLQDGKRDLVRDAMSKEGIGTMVYYPVPLHKLPMYRNSEKPLPVTERACRSVLSLPMWPHISPEALETVAKTLIGCLG